MLTRYLWGQINSACITPHQLTLTFGMRKGEGEGGWMLVVLLKHCGCKQRDFFLTVSWVNHNSKMTNGALIQFMNYAVVMATFIKMDQTTEHFVYEIMIYHVLTCHWQSDSVFLLAAVHTVSRAFSLKVFINWFVGVCMNEVLGAGTGPSWIETALAFPFLCQKVGSTNQQQLCQIWPHNQPD